MPRRCIHRVVGLLAVVATLSLACVATPVVPGPSSATDSGAVSTAPSPDLTGLDEATAIAVQVRTDFGLRSDLGFIRQVANDPTATSEFGTPLLPAEVAEINRRSEAVEDLAPIVQRYTDANVAVFGGIWIDQAAGGVITVSFTDDLERHRHALASLLAGRGVVKVVQARYAESVMRVLQERVTDDRDWFRTIPAALQGVGYDVKANALEITISTTNPNVAELVASRYGIPPDAIKVVSDGTGIALEPWGNISGRIVDVPARVVPELTLLYQSDRPGAQCGRNVGLGFTPAGTFELPCQGGHWVIEAGRNIEDIVARGEVDLEPGGTASVILRPVAP